MKKMLKKTGVAILTMAMLLSMGAMTAITASAADLSITVATSTGLSEDDSVSVYKVATKDASSWHWVGNFGNAGLDFKTISGYSNNSADVKTAATKLAAIAKTQVNGADATGKVGKTIPVTDAGYYLVIASPTNAALVAQPILLEVKDAATVQDVKVSPVSLTKVITKVQNETAKVATDGKSAEAASGDTIHYRLVAQIPNYDASADVNKMQPFYLKDTSMKTLSSVEGSFNVAIGDTNTAAATSGVTGDVTLVRTDAQNFKVTLEGKKLKDNGGKFLIVEFDATLGTDPVISKNLGVADRSDANKNDVKLVYGNDFATGQAIDKDGQPIDDEDKKPTLEDYADVYTSLLRVNKTFDNKKPTEGVSAKFALYANKECTAVVREAAETDSDGIVSFKGLSSGTYFLAETEVHSSYKKLAEPVEIKIDVDAAKAVYTPVTNVTPIDEDNDGKADGFETGINNPLLETLPATGGIGTYLFTIGGVSIVLLAGVLFVIYMKKRETEE